MVQPSYKEDDHLTLNPSTPLAYYEVESISFKDPILGKIRISIIYILKNWENLTKFGEFNKLLTKLRKSPYHWQF